jgi:hypothetical protein
VAREFVVDAMRLYPRLHRFEESDWRTPTDRLYSYNLLWQPSIDTDRALRTLADSPAFRAGALRRVHVSDLDAVKFSSPSTTLAVDTGVRCRCTRGKCFGCRCATSNGGKCGPRCHLPKSLRSLKDSNVHDDDDNDDDDASPVLTCYSNRCAIAPVALGPTRLDAMRSAKQSHERSETSETLCRVWAYRRSEHFKVSRVVAYPTTMRNDERRRHASLLLPSPLSVDDQGGNGGGTGGVNGGGTGAPAEFHATFQGTMLGARTEALVHSRGLARLVAPGSACIVTMGAVVGIRVASSPSRISETSASTADTRGDRGDRDGATNTADAACQTLGCLCRTPWRTWDAALDPVSRKRATTTGAATTGAATTAATGSETWARTVSAAEFFTATVAAPAIVPAAIPLASVPSSSPSLSPSSPIRRLRSSTRRRSPRST